MKNEGRYIMPEKVRARFKVRRRPNSMKGVREAELVGLVRGLDKAGLINIS
jgi:hypothetical protein